MGSRKPAGIDGLSERLRGALAQVETDLSALTAEIERDEEQDTDDTRAQLSELHAQATALAERVNELLERARTLVDRAEKRAETGNEFVSSFEDLAAGLDSAVEKLDPDTWDWEEDEEEAGDSD